MKEHRYLSNDELDRIRIEEDFLKGNLNRMCVSDDINELYDMCYFAIKRIIKINDICLNRFKDCEV